MHVDLSIITPKSGQNTYKSSLHENATNRQKLLTAITCTAVKELAVKERQDELSLADLTKKISFKVNNVE